MKNRPISPIPIINPRKFLEQKILALGTGPKIYLSCNQLLGNYQRFLIDTGGEVCLINATIIDIGKARRFRGLSDSTFETLGVAKLKILNIEVEFQVCREDLLFSEVGILGNNFLETEKAEISYD
ncbi:GSCOCG00010687001-RA-CDS, partial [Cotesia congregata]